MAHHPSTQPDHHVLSYPTDLTWRHQEGKLTQLSLADTIERLKHNFTIGRARPIVVSA